MGICSRRKHSSGVNGASRRSPRPSITTVNTIQILLDSGKLTTKRFLDSGRFASREKKVARFLKSHPIVIDPLPRVHSPRGHFSKRVADDQMVVHFSQPREKRPA